MTGRIVELLAAELDEAHASICHCIAGLTDEEFFWQPVPDCWTVHPDEGGRWVVDYVSLHHGAEIGCLRDLYRAGRHKNGADRDDTTGGCSC
jgi:hypothetical protein